MTPETNTGSKGIYKGKEENTGVDSIRRQWNSKRKDPRGVDLFSLVLLVIM